MESKIYHRPDCRYAKRIRYKNSMELPVAEARFHGYRPCKCCNTMAYLFASERVSLKPFEEDLGLRFMMLNDILFVKTSGGCWKIVYSRMDEKFALYHRNNSEREADFSEPQNGCYHRQKDKKSSNSIMSLCRYIYEHDHYREVQQSGTVLNGFISKKGKTLAERARKREKRKKDHRRIDQLFASLERENEGYRELSFC